MSSAASSRACALVRPAGVSAQIHVRRLDAAAIDTTIGKLDSRNLNADTANIHAVDAADGAEQHPIGLQDVVLPDVWVGAGRDGDKRMVVVMASYLSGWRYPSCTFVARPPLSEAKRLLKHGARCWD